MSGPKTSQAELERQRAAELARKRQALLEKLRSAQQKYRDAVADVRQRNAALAQLASSSNDTVSREASDLLKDLTPVDVADVKSPQSYLDSAEQTRLRAEAVAARIEAAGKKLRERSVSEANAADRVQAHQAIQTAFALSDPNPRSVFSAVRVDFQGNPRQDELRKQAREMAEQMDRLSRQNQSPFQKLAGETVSRLREIAEGSGDRSPEEVRDFLQDVVNRVEEIRRKTEALERQYADYTAAATLSDVRPHPLESFHSPEELRQETERLRQRCRELDEMNYISDQIEQTMQALGYQFVSSRAMRRKDSSEYDCSLYQADERTGVAVFTDQSGAVMMRMTVLGDGDITDADREFSYQRQIDFCAAHPEIVKTLAARGVFLSQRDYRPPDRKYTYKSAARYTGHGRKTESRGRRRHTYENRQREKGNP